MKSPEEIAGHISILLDELRWFHDSGITLNLKPTPKGWSLKVAGLSVSKSKSTPEEKP